MTNRSTARLWMIRAGILTLALSAAPAARAGFAFDFGTNPALPSAPGLTYAGGYGSVPESSVFSLAGGQLHLDTTGYARDVYAYYEVSGGYSSTMDAQLTTRVRVGAANVYGTGFAFYDNVVGMNLIVTRTGWFFYATGVSGTFADPNAYHAFDIKSFALTNSYTLSVDGVVVAAGSRFAGYGGPASVYFGDPTPTGGNTVADISYVTYNSQLPGQAQATPLPPTALAASAAGLLATLAGVLRRRRAGLVVTAPSA